jgi:hypothetical protein
VHNLSAGAASRLGSYLLADDTRGDREACASGLTRRSLYERNGIQNDRRSIQGTAHPETKRGEFATESKKSGSSRIRLAFVGPSSYFQNALDVGPRDDRSCVSICLRRNGTSAVFEHDGAPFSSQELTGSCPGDQGKNLNQRLQQMVLEQFFGSLMYWPNEQKFVLSGEPVSRRALHGPARRGVVASPTRSTREDMAAEAGPCPH